MTKLESVASVAASCSSGAVASSADSGERSGLDLRSEHGIQVFEVEGGAPLNHGQKTVGFLAQKRP